MVVRAVLYLFSISYLVAALLMLYYMVVPIYLEVPVFAVYLLLHPWPAILPACVFLAAGWFLWRKKYKGPAATFIACFVFSSALVLAPVAGQVHYASSVGSKVKVAHSMVFGKPESGTDRFKSVVYGTASDGSQLVLDFWAAKNGKGNKLKPAIIRMHGGGWNYGKKSDMPVWNKWLNEQGYHVFDVEYRLPPPVRWKDEIGDVKCAMGWVMANAALYNVDTNRIALMGNSAGGNLAMLAAYTYGDTILTSSCPTRDVTVKAVINIYGPTELKSIYHMKQGGELFHSSMHSYIGGSPEDYPERYRLLSPIYHVRSGIPATLTIHGETDRIVPAEQAISLDNQFEKAGVPHELVLIPLTDHGFDVNWNSVSTQIARDRIKAFLAKHLQ